MERRFFAATPATQVAAAAARAGETVTSISEATGIPLSALTGADNSAELTVSDLGRVGGFLRVRPSELIRGAA